MLEDIQKEKRLPQKISINFYVIPIFRPTVKNDPIENAPLVIPMINKNKWALLSESSGDSVSHSDNLEFAAKLALIKGKKKG